MSLRPGELKILESVTKERKSFSELKKETELDDSILSIYLKNLQKLGLLIRDIDSRKYAPGAQTTEALFQYDILAFLKEQFARKEHIVRCLSLFVGEPKEKEFNNIIAKSLWEPDIARSLAILASLPEKLWREFKLKTLQEKQRKIVVEYEQALWDNMVMLNRELRNKPERLNNESLRDFFRHLDLEDLNGWVRFMKEKGLLVSETELSQNERDKMIANWNFLKNEKNLKIYQGYRQKINIVPKTLFLLPSSGFSGYSKLFRSYFAGLDMLKQKSSWCFPSI